MSLTLKSQRFRAERESDWLRLDRLLNLLEAGRRTELSDDDVTTIDTFSCTTGKVLKYLKNQEAFNGSLRVNDAQTSPVLATIDFGFKWLQRFAEDQISKVW